MTTTSYLRALTTTTTSSSLTTGKWFESVGKARFDAGGPEEMWAVLSIYA